MRENIEGKMGDAEKKGALMRLVESMDGGVEAIRDATYETEQVTESVTALKPTHISGVWWSRQLSQAHKNRLGLFPKLRKIDWVITNFPRNHGKP